MNRQYDQILFISYADKEPGDSWTRRFAPLTISILVDDKECSVTNHHFLMWFLMQMVLLSFRETSIHYQIDKLRFYERW